VREDLERATGLEPATTSLGNAIGSPAAKNGAGFPERQDPGNTMKHPATEGNSTIVVESATNK